LFLSIAILNILRGFWRVIRSEGASLGNSEGESEGASLGNSEGKSEGTSLGNSEGESEGSPLGNSEGEVLGGTSLGTYDGAALGTRSF
jgi:hypothetical protein